MNDWWWQVVTDFYKRVASATYHDPSEPPPQFYAEGMLNLIGRITADPQLVQFRPGLHRRTLTLRPESVKRKVLVRWVASELYEIEMEGGGEMLELPWDGRIIVPGDVVLDALVNCKHHLEGQEPPHDNGYSHAATGF